jgi:hypothetical protein
VSIPLICDGATKLIVASCQFPVSDDVAANSRYLKRQTRAARATGADVARFCAFSPATRAL